MYSKRGGRVQISVLQFQELVERVAVLEKLNGMSGKPETVELTKPEIMAKLDGLEISYNPRDKKEVLMSLLSEE